MGARSVGPSVSRSCNPRGASLIVKPRAPAGFAHSRLRRPCWSLALRHAEFLPQSSLYASSPSSAPAVTQDGIIAALSTAGSYRPPLARTSLDSRSPTVVLPALGVESACIGLAQPSALRTVSAAWLSGEGPVPPPATSFGSAAEARRSLVVPPAKLIGRLDGEGAVAVPGRSADEPRGGSALAANWLA